MRAVYRDRRQNSCSCNIHYNTLWVGRGGTARLCDCPDYLDIPVYSPGIGLAIKLRRHSRLKKRIRSAQEDFEQAFFKSEEMFGI